MGRSPPCRDPHARFAARATCCARRRSSTSSYAQACTPGECEAIGDDIGGLAVHIGARVAASAGPGEVLVSSTVKDLVVGSGLRFDDRGEHELKGVPGPWRLYALADGAADAQTVDAAAAHMTAGDRATVRLARHAPGLLRVIGRVTLRERRPA